MDKYIIDGGHKLSGEIKVAGAKNQVGKILAASIAGNPTLIGSWAKIISALLPRYKHLIK